MQEESVSSGIDFRKHINEVLKELFRKIIHICTAFIPALLHIFGKPVLGGLAAILVLYCISEALRLAGKNVPVISAVTQAAARKRDENRFVLGPVTLVCGIILTALLFNPVPAAVGIYSLAFGDGLASLAGKLFGHIKIPFTNGKTVAGSLTCFIAIFAASFFTVDAAGIALCIGCIGMCIELLPLKDFDNLFIPLILAAVCQFGFAL